MTSRSKEDYLKNIYHIQEEGRKVNTGSLAAALAISPASVSEMVNKLSKDGLIDNKPYHGFELTVDGMSSILNAGDGYYFPTTLPHRFRNIGADEAEIISANTPANF